MNHNWNPLNNSKKITLNPQQLDAIQNTIGPSMIIAGPGSGKTKVITERIAHLIKSGINAENILALTFTNKAAKEMRNRINQIINNNDVFSIWMGTFHSIFAKILRKEASTLGYSENFTIYDNDDSVKLIRRIVKDFNLDKDIYNSKYIFAKISFMKNNLINYREYKNNAELIKEDNLRKRSHFINIYQKYCETCKQSNCLDFDDLLIKTHELFRKNSHILEYYQNIFQYVLIDEYQDTNKVQDAIVKQVSKKHQNVCVVGDDSQSIYSFRGANINNMLNFKSFYQNVTEFKLEQNYRSTQNIVNAANSLIANNQKKIQKTIFSKNEEGEKIQLHTYNTDREEGDRIISIIQNSLNQNTLKSEHAILYRTNSQSKVLEDALRKRGIKYKIFGGLSFYQRKEIKDTMAFLKLIINNYDNEALLRIINYPTRGIGHTTINKIRQKSEEKNMSIWSVISSNLIDELKLTSGTKTKVLSFVKLINTLFSYKQENVFKIIEKTIDITGLVRRLEDDPTPENINRIENIGELVNTMKLFSLRPKNNQLIHFINEISLDETKEDNEETEYVSLMTIHQSKGLEYPYIYVVGLENNLFPSQKSMQQRFSLEEERRLLYVAITRAIKKVTLSHALNRFRFGSMGITEKSIFIDEINPLFIESKKLQNRQTYQNKQFKAPRLHNKILRKINKTSQNTQQYRNDLQVGQKIIHNVFGKGEIKNIDISDGNQKIQVYFEQHGDKLLLTKFAKFKIIM